MSTKLKDIKKIDLSSWISQSEAARLRGVTRQAIAKLVKNKRLKTLEIGGHTLVNREEVINFKALSAGRPKKGENDK